MDNLPERPFKPFDRIKVLRTTRYPGFFSPGGTGTVVGFRPYKYVDGKFEWDLEVHCSCCREVRLLAASNVELLEQSNYVPIAFKVGDFVRVSGWTAYYTDYFRTGSLGQIVALGPDLATVRNAIGDEDNVKVWDLSLRKPPIKVDPKDIFVSEGEISAWNPYPFKEKLFYGR
jgi:hypothetical protein